MISNSLNENTIQQKLYHGKNLKSLCYKETYLEPSQASKIELYAKIVNG